MLFFLLQIELHLLKSHPMQLSIHTLLANSITDGVVVPPVVGSCAIFLFKRKLKIKVMVCVCAIDKICLVLLVFGC